MFELRPFERRNNHVAAYDPWDQMERAFFGDGSWGRGLSEFKTDIQDKGDSYLLEADLPGFKKEDIHVDHSRRAPQRARGSGQEGQLRPLRAQLRQLPARVRHQRRRGRGHLRAVQ